jgi:ribonuclease HI
LKSVVIFTDGGASPNPGPAAIGAVIKDKSGIIVGCISQSIGYATNNEAEYRAVIAALQMALKLGVQQVELRSDSELLVRQINGQYKVKAAGIRPFYIEIKHIQEQFERCIFNHIPRELNEAHEYADKKG